MGPVNSLCSWIGGKESCFDLMTAFKNQVTSKVLLNVLNEEGKISRSHGIPSSILRQQAEACGLPLHLVASSWQDYEKHFVKALVILKKEYDLTHAVFGDIDLQAH